MFCRSRCAHPPQGSTPGDSGLGVKDGAEGGDAGVGAFTAKNFEMEGCLGGMGRSAKKNRNIYILGNIYPEFSYLRKNGNCFIHDFLLWELKTP